MERRSLKAWTPTELQAMIKDRGKRMKELTENYLGERKLLLSDISLLTAEVARRAGNED